MASEVIMPKMGDAMMEGKIVRWYKKAGDAVKKGEPVLEIETDKVNLDLEAEANGILGNVAFEEGQMAEVGAVLATIGAEGEAAKPKPAAKSEAKSEAKSDTPARKEESSPKREIANELNPPAQTVQAPEQPRHQAQGTEAPAAGGHIKSSPLARRMAKEMGVELGSVRGSGPNGRVVAADVESASKAPRATEAPRPQALGTEAPKSGTEAQTSKQAPALVRPSTIEAKSTPLSGMRRTIAKRLSESLGPVPHFYLTIDTDVSDLLALRKQVNELGGSKVSVNDFVIKAAALALLHHPNVNASFTDEAIVQHGEISIGVAVATPEGLITPIIRNADQKGVAMIAGEVKELADKAKNRKLLPNDYQGGTFTISNLGMFGIDEFTAIINPPNSAILAVGAATPQVVVDANRQMVVRDRMKITMSCDHRVIDGAAGAQYLQTLRQYIEQPLRILL